MKSDVKHRGKQACISMPKNSGFFRRKLFRIGGIRRARKLFNVLAVGIRLIASMRRSNMFAIMFVKSHISMCFFTIRVFFGLGTVLPRTQLYASTHFNFRSSTRYVRQIAVKKIICWVMNLQRVEGVIEYRHLYVGTPAAAGQDLLKIIWYLFWVHVDRQYQTGKMQVYFRGHQLSFEISR